MDKTNSKILTVSFALAGALVGLTLSLLITAFAGVFGWMARLSSVDMFRHGIPVGIGFLVFLVLQLNPRILAWGDEVVSEIRKVVAIGKRCSGYDDRSDRVGSDFKYDYSKFRFCFGLFN